MTHVAYPSMLQREGGWVFTPWLYTTIEFVNVHVSWLSLYAIPVTFLACMTEDRLLTLVAVFCVFTLCWASGFR